MNDSSTVTRRSLPQVTDADLDPVLQRSGEASTLLYFTTTWCGPCKTFGPRLERFLHTHPERVLLKVDGDECPAFMHRFGVHAFPSLVLVRHGKIQWTHLGDLEDGPLGELLQTVLSAADDTAPAGPATAQQPDFGFPLSLTVPDLGDPRIALHIWHREQREMSALRPGQTVALQERDIARLFVSADERLDVPLDLSPLSQLPAAPYEVVVQTRSAPADQLRTLRVLSHITQLILMVQEPLTDEAIDTLASVPMDSLQLRATDAEVEALVARLPGIAVNGVTRSAEFAAELGPVGQSLPADETEWTSPERLRELVAAGESFLAMVQAEHPHDRSVAASWHASASDLADVRTATVSAYGDDELLRELCLEHGQSALVWFADGAARLRCDLPTTDELTGLDPTALGVASSTAEMPMLASLPERVLRLNAASSTELAFELVPPGAVHAGALISAASGTPQTVPEGWRVRAVHMIAEGSSLPMDVWLAADLQDLHLYVGREPGTVDLTELTKLPHLEQLTVHTSPPVEAALRPLLGSLPRLRNLRLVNAGEDLVAQARRELPSTLVNGCWPADNPLLTIGRDSEEHQ
ncbi:thioredoxin family protein [Streptomyces sp. NPDC091217]|uniref:thioredoxin family protein n=1 Tax=Streptomyces sp. NPDC091217 TaxID=3365975 RepID=UPI00380167FD